MAKRTKDKAEPAPFDFYDYLYVLERALPKRSKARKLIPELETFVARLRTHERNAWDKRDYRLGDVRSAAQRELLDILLAIPERWNEGSDGIVMTAFGCWLALTTSPPEVRSDAMEFLKREQCVSYVRTFVTLRSKGHVALTRKSVPAKGSDEERWAQGGAA